MIFSQQFDNILSLLPEGILITNYNGEHLYVNKSYEKFSGVSREHVLKRNIYQLKNEGFFNLFLNPDVIKQRKKITAVQKIKGGRSVLLEAHPIFDDSGEVCLVVTFVRDNTSIEILKQQISLQEELLKTFQKIHLSDVNRLVFPFVLESAIMHKFFTKLLMVSASDATILLQGETGTGKDVFARKIHCNSPRAEKPFIKVDCSSLPENLIEAELFGYTAGSFSGAHTRGKIGLIEAASSGTVFLDEVGELPLLMQSRLLRVLQNREIVRIGATSPSPVNVRFIAATNKDLEKEVLCGHFRSDLYYRLKVAEFFVPPLRSHTEDILPMAHIFIEHFSNRYNLKCGWRQIRSNVFCVTAGREMCVSLKI